MENKLIKINNQNIKVKEFKGQRVVTFKDIDTLHQRAEGTASRNFYENKFEADGITERFIKGEDYFNIASIQKNEFRTFDIPNRGLVLITESGYLMLVKSFNDDLAWKVQRQLVNNYFRKRTISKNQIEEVLNIKEELQDEISVLVQKGIEDVKEKCAQYYRPAAFQKYRITNYIKKRLGIERSNEEFDLVKQRIFIMLKADKWEDIPIETLVAPETLKLIDQSIDAIMQRRNLMQISFFNDHKQKQ